MKGSNFSYILKLIATAIVVVISLIIVMNNLELHVKHEISTRYREFNIHIDHSGNIK